MAASVPVRPSPQRFRSSFLRTGPVILLTLIMASAAPGQTGQLTEDIDSPGLTIEAIAGWDGTVDHSVPVPVSFLIRNDSEQIIEGHLRLSNPWGGDEVTLGEVVVAPGTARRFASIQALTDWYVCIATLSDGRRVLWRRELSLSGNDFDPNINFALFIDDSGRRLQLPGAVSGTASNLMVAGEQGRPFQCLTVKTWQVPDHPGPLVPARAMIFPEGAAEDELNYLQWRAVAEWVCQGGALFVHDESGEIIDRLLESAPLGAEPAVVSGELLVRRVGLGAVYEYPQPLLASGRNESRQQIAETIAKMTNSHISTLVDSMYAYNTRGGRADLNRVLVVAFFGFYTFLSGVVAMLLFRLTRHRIAAYTVVIVVGASILSALLGGFLRFSRGDLRWVTVTRPGAGGAVQVGRIEVQSAGGRNTHVAIRGEHPDLQFIGGDQGYYAWRRPQPNYPPFTWQPNLATGADDTWRINVPMTPWGRRRCHATDYSPELQRLNFELEFEPRVPPGGREQETSTGVAAGEFSLKLVNRLSFDITECWLVIGVTGAFPDQAGSMQTSQYGRWQFPANSPAPGDLTDLYQIHRLQELPVGDTLQDTIPAEFRVMQNDWERTIQSSRASLIPPRISHLGTASAWIIAIIEESPVIHIDQEHSDFVPHEQLHVFLQEIRPEDMPDAALFVVGGTAAADDATAGSPD